jgi:hypothetical protein
MKSMTKVHLHKEAPTPYISILIAALEHHAHCNWFHESSQLVMTGRTPLINTLTLNGFWRKIWSWTCKRHDRPCQLSNDTVLNNNITCFQSGNQVRPLCPCTSKGASLVIPAYGFPVLPTTPGSCTVLESLSDPHQPPEKPICNGVPVLLQQGPRMDLLTDVSMADPGHPTFERK